MTQRHFEVERLDPVTGIVSRRVILQPGAEFDEIVTQLFDENSPVKGHFVSNDVPLGDRAKGKVFKYRATSSQISEVTINYKIVNGAPRFVGYKDLLSDGYVISVRHSDVGDLLEIDLGKSKFAPTDGKEVTIIRRIFKSVQEFNNELLGEVDDDEVDDIEEKGNHNHTDKTPVNPYLKNK